MFKITSELKSQILTEADLIPVWNSDEKSIRFKLPTELAVGDTQLYKIRNQDWIELDDDFWITTVETQTYENIHSDLPFIFVVALCLSSAKIISSVDENSPVYQLQNDFWVINSFSKALYNLGIGCTINNHGNQIADILFSFDENNKKAIVDVLREAIHDRKLHSALELLPPNKIELLINWLLAGCTKIETNFEYRAIIVNNDERIAACIQEQLIKCGVGSKVKWIEHEFERFSTPQKYLAICIPYCKESSFLFEGGYNKSVEKWWIEVQHEGDEYLGAVIESIETVESTN